MPRSLSCFSIAGDTPGSFLRSSATPRGPAMLFEAEIAGCRLRRDFLDNDRLLLRADVNARLALRARDAVDRGLGDEIAIERHRAAGVVVARDHVGDAVRIAVGVDHRGDP